MLLAHILRDALLERSLPAAAPSPSAALRQRLYLKAVSLAPPSATALRGAAERKALSDEALLSAYLHGEAGAFEVLMDRHLGWMVGWARKHLPDAEAEDAAQEAFLDLAKRATSLQTGATLRGFLFGLLRIAVLRALRTLARHRGEPLEDEGAASDRLVDPQPSPEVTFLARRAYREVAEALSNVCTLREQEVILFTLEGQDDKTLAEALEISENNIRVTRYRALARLRKALADPDSGGGDGR
jgi:RNA polymerase sigma factor (sigma-70 family)